MIKKLKIFLMVLILAFSSFVLSGCVDAEDVSFNNPDEQWES